MNLRFFIDRPVFSIVISVVIVLLGIISLAGLPVEQYPDIAPPTVQVTTSYPGANAETVQKAVIIPLEEAINGVENMSYIHSEASNTGDVTVNVYFRQGTDADMAAVNVQNRVSKAQGLLPAEVTKIGVQTQKQQKSLLKVVALYSPDDTYDMQFINNYMKINVEPRVKRIAGVGEFNVLASNYSMRIWLKPDVLAQYRLIPSDVTDALERQNLESATGSFGENHANTYEYTIKYRGRFSTPEEFGNIVIRSLGNGEILRLKDIARVELGDEAYTYRAMTDGHAGCIAEAYQSAGSNATEVVRNIDALIDEIGGELPEGLEFASLLSVNDFLFASIENVLWTLIEAILLVVLVVYVFLQDIRSTLIPTISIIVSLVGTFAFMAVAGFSINLLTLFALVLAIGTVVDNAIVVVEAVQAKFDAGYYSSYMATNEAMSGITAAIITSTLVFMAVFIPVSMMGGTSGVFYTQFGITMAVAVGLSAVNALTLSPALCALLLRPYFDAEGKPKTGFAARFRKAFNAAFDVIVKRYVRGVIYFCRHRAVTWGLLASAVVLLVVLMRTTKTGLVPDEDTGTVMVSINTKPGSSFHRTTRILAQLEKEIQQMPQVRHYATVSNFNRFSKLYRVMIQAEPDSRVSPESLNHIYVRTGNGEMAPVSQFARLQIEEAEASLMNARLSYLPSFSLSPEAGVSRYDGTTARTYNIAASASWEQDIFGRNTNVKRAAAAALHGSRDYAQAVQTQLIATIANSYYTLLMLDAQREIGERTVKNWEQTIRTMEALKQAGQTNDAAVLQARANKMQLEASLLSIVRSITEMENALSALLALPSQTVERGSLASAVFPDHLSAGLPVALLANRPDVRQAERSLAQAFYRTNAARSVFYPALTLSGSAGWTNNGGGVVVNPGKWLLNAVGSLTQPIFNKGANVANLKIAKAQQEEALLKFRQSLLDAGKEVNDALTQWQTARQSIDLGARRIETLRAAVSKTEMLMRHSSANYLEVLTAQQSLLDCEQTQAQNRFDEIQGVINLYRALGGGQF